MTYWGTHDKASRELGFAPRTLAQGVADTWGGTPAWPDRADRHTLGPMARELPIFEPNPAHAHAQASDVSIAMGGGSFDPAPDGTLPLRRHPDWIKARLPSGDNFHDLKGLLRGLNLNTVCEEARCPNIGDCWDQRTATVMILGDVCTRACGFCAIKTGRPTWFDDDEPRRVAEAVTAMRLDHVVVTSVARDDLPDGGAGAFAATIRELRARNPLMGVEVLIPDFNGEAAPLRTVMEAAPDILNHNLETVRRLQKPVRKRARWDRSLGVLERAKAYAQELGHDVHTKSSLMVGLGETREELTEAFEALREVDTRHPHDRPVPAADDRPPAARALLPPRRVRRDEGERPGPRLQARRIGPARPLQLSRTGPGPGRGAQGAPPPGDPRRRRPGGPGRGLIRQSGWPSPS